MGRLQIMDLTVSYHGKAVIENFSLEIFDGEFVSLLGPSGCGKTTLLKTIAGLHRADSGQISIDGQPVDHLPAEKRDTVLIFQKPMLFPFLCVAKNIGFGLRMQRVDKGVAEEKIDRMLEITGLDGLKNRKVHQLSGGQQQRVALARGLVMEPSILLLDEPFSNLDVELRLQMRALVKNVHSRTGTTMFFVTHDQSEAFSMSDRACLLLDGTLRQTGKPEDLFYRPADTEAARFFGYHNFINGSVSNKIFSSDILICPAQIADSPKATAVIRPEDLVVYPDSTEQGVAGKVLHRLFEGSTTRLTIEVKGHLFTACSIRPQFAAGQRVRLYFPPKRLHILTENSPK